MAISWRLLDRRRLLVTALCLVAWRALDQLPITGLKGQGIQLFQGIGGGGQFGPYSLGSVGIGAYIFALVILSVLPAISGRVWAMKKTADGRASLRRWAIALAILLAFAQAYSITELIQNTRVGMWFPPLDWFTRLVICLELAGGTVIVILLADLINEFGLGLGYAAFLLFALRAVALQIHRLADYADGWVRSCSQTAESPVKEEIGAPPQDRAKPDPVRSDSASPDCRRDRVLASVLRRLPWPTV